MNSVQLNKVWLSTYYELHTVLGASNPVVIKTDTSPGPQRAYSAAEKNNLKIYNQP